SGYTLPCFTSSAALTIISGVMKFSIPRLSCSPHRPQLPRGPHLPGTVQGAGSLASFSSSGCAGTGVWAHAMGDSPSSDAMVAIVRTNVARNRMVGPPQRRVKSHDPVGERPAPALYAEGRGCTGDVAPARG